MTTLTVSHDGVSASVEFDRADGDRDQYTYRIFESDGSRVLAEGSDLRTPADQSTLPSVMVTLLSFLGAWAEAQRYPNSENRDLFPAAMAEAVRPEDWEDWASYVGLELERGE